MSTTKRNLKGAFAGESQANRRYIFFAEVAQREGYRDVASLFKRTAEEETEHARAIFNMLYPQITTKDALRMALEGETLETKMYPEYAETAEREGKAADAAELRRLLNEAKGHFELFAETEKKHAEAYKKELENLFQEYEKPEAPDVPTTKPYIFLSELTIQNHSRRMGEKRQIS